MITFLDTFTGVDGTLLSAHVADEGFGAWAEYNVDGYPGDVPATLKSNQLIGPWSDPGGGYIYKTYISGNPMDLSKDFEAFMDFFSSPDVGQSQQAVLGYFDPALAPDPNLVLRVWNLNFTPSPPEKHGVQVDSSIADFSAAPLYTGSLPARFGVTYTAATNTAQTWTEPAGGGTRTYLSAPTAATPFVSAPAALWLVDAQAPLASIWVDNLTVNTHLLQPTATPAIFLPVQMNSHGFRCCLTLDITQAPGTDYELWVKPTAGIWTMISSGPLPTVLEGVLQCLPNWTGGLPSTTYQVAVRLKNGGDYNPGASNPDPSTWPAPSQTTVTTLAGQGGPYTPAVPASPESDPAVPGTLNCDT